MRKCEALIGLSETEYELRILAAVYPFCGPTSFDETGQRAPVDSLAIGFLPTLESLGHSLSACSSFRSHTLFIGDLNSETRSIPVLRDAH